MRRKLLMIAIPAAGAAAAIGMATAALAASSPAGAPAAAAALTSPASAVSQAQAEQAALGYLTAHYPGTGTATLLAAHAGSEHGQAVYEVRATAPDGKTYEVYVSQASGAVLSSGREDSGDGDQSGGDDSSGTSIGTGHHDDGAEHPDGSAGHGDQLDR